MRAEGVTAGVLADFVDQPASLFAVFEAVRAGRVKTRSAIAEWTGLGRKVVAQRVEQLLRAGLIDHGDFAASTGGRAARELHFNASAAHFLVADFNTTRIAVGICDLSGTLLTAHEEAADGEGHVERAINRVEALFDGFLAERPDPSPPIWGIGVGSLGPVDVMTGRPVSLPSLPEWQNYPLRDRFSKRYDVPVWVDNGVNFMAVGEFRGGIARGVDDLLFVELGKGIGSAVISDGRLTRGAMGFAGEIGHLPVAGGPEIICWCGNTACLVQIAGGEALARTAAQAVAGGAPSVLSTGRRRGRGINTADVATAARRGDALCIDLIAEAGRVIGRSIATLVTINNPSMIILGGTLTHAGDVFLATIRESIYKFAMPLATRGLKIQLSASSDRAVLMGAGFTVIDALLSPPILSRWIDFGSPVGHAGALYGHA